ncbi:MAG: DUF5908 family protein [Nannocystaceae bacterium]|nr:hypothetical protein [Myxococcales bacterium]
MPVEIKELVISVSVRGGPDEPRAPAPARAVAPTDHDERAALVQECVREVMAILRRERER